MAKDFEDSLNDKPIVKEFKERKLTVQRVIYEGMNCAKKIVYEVGTLESAIKPDHKRLIGTGDFK